MSGIVVRTSGLLDAAVHLMPAHQSLGSIPKLALIYCGDHLAVGPCNVDPLKHQEDRRAYFDGWPASPTSNAKTKTGRLRRSADVPRRENCWSASNLKELEEALNCASKSTPIVVWTSPSYVERLKLFWFIDSFERLQIDRTRVWISQSCGDDEPGGVSRSLGAHPDANLAEAFSKAFQVSNFDYDQLAKLWQYYACDDAANFDQQRRRPLDLAPFIGSDTNIYVDLFPQMDGDGKLQLSSLDQSLLQLVPAEQFVTVAEVMIALASSRQNLQPCFGELIFLNRLCEFARAESSPLLELQIVEGVNRLTQTRFKLTSCGKQVIAEGLSTMNDAPPMHVGGAIAYRDGFFAARDGNGRAAICTLRRA